MVLKKKHRKHCLCSERPCCVLQELWSLPATLLLTVSKVWSCRQWSMSSCQHHLLNPCIVLLVPAPCQSQTSLFMAHFLPCDAWQKNLGLDSFWFGRDVPVATFVAGHHHFVPGNCVVSWQVTTRRGFRVRSFWFIHVQVLNEISKWQWSSDQGVSLILSGCLERFKHFRAVVQLLLSCVYRGNELLLCVFMIPVCIRYFPLRKTNPTSPARSSTAFSSALFKCIDLLCRENRARNMDVKFVVVWCCDLQKATICASITFTGASHDTLQSLQVLIVWDLFCRFACSIQIQHSFD